MNKNEVLNQISLFPSATLAGGKYEEIAKVPDRFAPKIIKDEKLTKNNNFIAFNSILERKIVFPTV